MRIIAVANQKGGCGKTTTAINLSASLSLKGKRVLLIDCDPQAHATLGLSKNPSVIEQGLYHALTLQAHGGKSIDDILMPIKDGFDLAPSSVVLSALEQELAGIEGRETRILQAVRAIRKPYDYIVMDCPPSIGLLSMNALRACEEVIIPIDMSLFSLRGVAKLTEILLLFKDKVGHDIKPRALVTMFDVRTRYSKQVLQKVKETFGSNVFESVIRYNIRLRETVDYGMPIGDYDKHSIGFKDYLNLAEEVIRFETAGLHAQTGATTAEALLSHSEHYMDTVAQATEDGLVVEDEADTLNASSLEGEFGHDEEDEEPTYASEDSVHSEAAAEPHAPHTVHRMYQEESDEDSDW